MFRDAVPILYLFFAAVLLAVSALYPSAFSDGGNSFLKDFMDNDVLSVLGFITALSNASILSIFLHLNYLEDEVEFIATNTRRGLRLSAISLVVIFLAAFAIVILKPILPAWEVASAIANALGILLVVFALSVLRDITLTVIKIPSKRRIVERQKKNRQDAAASDNRTPQQSQNPKTRVPEG